MSVALQVAITGLAAGGVYGLVAVGYSLVFRLTGTIAFAFGDLIGLGVFATLLVAAGTGPVSQTSVGGARYALAVVCGLLICIAAGVAGYLLVVEPFLVRGSTVGWIAGTLALAFAIRAVLQSVFPREAYVFPDPIPFERLGDGRVRRDRRRVDPDSRLLRDRRRDRARARSRLAAGTNQDRPRAPRDRRGRRRRPPGRRSRRSVRADRLRPRRRDRGARRDRRVPERAGHRRDMAARRREGACRCAVARFVLPWPALVAGLGLGIAEAAVAEVHVGSLQPGAGWSALLPLGLALAVLAARPPDDARDDTE